MNAYKILRTHWLSQVRAARREYRAGVGSFGAWYAMGGRLRAIREQNAALSAVRW
jgi:hypothetical protein